MVVGPSGTLLVVDDEDDLRRLLVLALRRHDFEVLEASTGEAAMEILASQPVDVLVLDMGLSGMSGIAVVKGDGRRHAVLRLAERLSAGC